MRNFYFVFALAAIVGCVTITSCSKAVSVTDSKKMKKKLNEPAEVEVTFPCAPMDYQSDKNFIRATGSGWSMDMQVANSSARQEVLKALGFKIGTSIKGLAVDNLARKQIQMTEEITKTLNEMTKNSYEHELASYKIICEKYTKNPQTKNFTCYMAIEIEKDKLLRPIYQRLSANDILRIDDDYETFKKEFDKKFSK
ncbi:MAG: hypothetical protein FWC39_10495 [Bacteroidetes bacterium]|nr:hypothetical protein [Bacteroidota bacterium]